MAAVTATTTTSMAASATTGKKVDWSTYEYKPCCYDPNCQEVAIPQTVEGKIFYGCIQLLFNTTRPVCTLHCEGTKYSDDEIQARITRAKQLIPQLTTYNGYTGASYKEGMDTVTAAMISHVFYFVQNPTQRDELLALIFQKTPFQPNRVVREEGFRISQTLSNLLKLDDPVFHAVVVDELRRLRKETDKNVTLDYVALRKRQKDAATAKQQISDVGDKKTPATTTTTKK